MRKLPRVAASPAAALAAALTASAVTAGALTAGAVTVWPAARLASAATITHRIPPGRPRIQPGGPLLPPPGRPRIQPGGPMIGARHPRVLAAVPAEQPAGPAIRPLGPASRHAGPAARPAGPAIQPGGPANLIARPRRSRVPIMSINSLASFNWGGYAAFRPGVRFRFVRASFFVPYLDCTSTPNAQSAHWVGLDGLHDSTVEQAGISANCRGDSPVYRAWYEMVPQAPVYPHLDVSPGDSIVASVYFSRQTSRFIMRLADTTNGHHVSQTAACPAGASCDRSAAEAISEPPLGPGGYLPLANFRALDYGDIRVTDQAGRRGGLRAPWWDTSKLTTVSPGGAVLDQPTALRRGRAFSVYWLREK